MKNTTNFRVLPLTLVISLGLAASGCAVGPLEVRERVEQKTTDIVAATASAQTQNTQEPPWLRIPGNFLGSSPRAIDTTTNLPAQYRNITLNFGPNSQGPLSQAVSNIRASTGLHIRVNAEVLTTGNTGSPAALAPSPVPLPSGAMAAPGQILPSQVSATPGAAGMNSSGRFVPLTFEGDLSEYLNKIASILDISWEYTNGEVYLFRTMTREFTLMISPGTNTYKDDMSGAQGTGVQLGASNASLDAKALNPWTSIDAGIRTMLSASGKHSINESSGSVTVSDTKSVVERISKYLKHENAILGAQVDIAVRQITVQLDDKTEVGLDLNLIYRKLNASTGGPDWSFQSFAPASLTSSASGSSTFNVLKPNAYWAGSNAAVQALNSIGQVVSDTTDNIVTTNRVPGRMQQVTNEVYLASTTPATGGGTAGGVGVPGITPGTVSYGSNITVVPTIGENNSVLMQIFDTRSDLLGIGSIGTGAGQTSQQINTPKTKLRKNSQNFFVGQGETLVIVGSIHDSTNATTAYGVTGASAVGKRTKTISVTLLTPRIHQQGS